MTNIFANRSAVRAFKERAKQNPRAAETIREKTLRLRRERLAEKNKRKQDARRKREARVQLTVALLLVAGFVSMGCVQQSDGSGISYVPSVSPSTPSLDKPVVPNFRLVGAWRENPSNASGVSCVGSTCTDTTNEVFFCEGTTTVIGNAALCDARDELNGTARLTIEAPRNVTLTQDQKCAMLWYGLNEWNCKK